MGVDRERTRSVARYGHLTGDGPDERGPCAGDGHDHWVRLLPAGHEVSETLTEADRGFPRHGLDDLGALLQAHLERTADLGRNTIRPRRREEGPAGDGVAGFRAGALAAPRAPGLRTGGESPRAQELSGVVNTGQIPECGDEREGLDDGGQAPRVDLRAEFGLEALEPFLMCPNGADVRLEDQLRGRGGTDHCRQPAQTGWPPGGAALIPKSRAQPDGL
jgi:hypothetical protein